MGLIRECSHRRELKPANSRSTLTGGPAARAGAVTSSVSSSSVSSSVPGVPPKNTFVISLRRVPRICTRVVALAGPLKGDTLVTTGGPEITMMDPRLAATAHIAPIPAAVPPATGSVENAIVPVATDGDIEAARAPAGRWQADETDVPGVDVQHVHVVGGVGIRWSRGCQVRRARGERHQQAIRADRRPAAGAVRVRSAAPGVSRVVVSFVKSLR